MLPIVSVQLPNRSGVPGQPFYRDAFSVLDVVAQYDAFFKLGLTDQEKSDLIRDVFGPAAGSRAVHQPQEDTAGGWSR